LPKDEKPGYFDNTPLILAARKGNAAFVTLLLKSNANINFANKKGNTALHAAVKANSHETLETLLSSPDILPELKNAKGDTAFIKSIKLNYEKCTIVLQQYARS